MIKKCNCGVQSDHDVKEINQNIGSIEKHQELAEFFKVFGDSTRIKILSVLRQDVCL